MALPGRSDTDTQIIADQERKIARLRAEELVIERFNPRDDDSFDIHSTVDAVADFVESVACTCPPGAHSDVGEEDPCARCEVLGRRCNEVLAR